MNGMIWESLMILGDKNLALTLGALLTLRQLLKSKLQEKARIGRIGEIIPSKCRGDYFDYGNGRSIRRYSSADFTWSRGFRICQQSKLWITGHPRRCLFYHLGNPHCTGKCHCCHGYLYWHSWRSRGAGNRHTSCLSCISHRMRSQADPMDE